jgi:GTPase
MRFVDEAVIMVRSGDGGGGSVSFRRERFIPRGGPDGGDGGRGGSVFVEAKGRLHTLADFTSRSRFSAERGRPGAGNNRTGRDGRDVLIEVPPGTLITDEDTGEKVADLVREGERRLVAAGGRGGKGNKHFATSTRRAPRFAQPGLPGEARRLRLSLRHLAEVGLVGLPNAGKSTLLSGLTDARPEVGDYPFTTLTPNLGVLVYDDGAAFTLADIPGLIEGAGLGRGLGVRFLKHIERTRLLLHLLDATAGGSPRSLVDAHNSVRTEMERYSPLLLQKEEIVLLNKVDALPPGRLPELDQLRRTFEDRGFPCLLVSGLKGQGLVALKALLRRKLIHEGGRSEKEQ